MLNPVLRFIAKRSHWQIFLLLCLLAFFTGSSVTGQILHILFYGLWFLWINSVGTVALESLPVKRQPDKTFFDASCIIIIGVNAILTVAFPEGTRLTTQNLSQYGVFQYIIFIAGLYSFFSIIYVLYFAAKMLASSAEKSLVTFEKYFVWFLALFMFPIGVWFIQPRAQALVRSAEQPALEV